MNDLLKTGRVLGREEMKKISAGSTNCVICWNDDSIEIIHHSFNGEEPTQVCRRNGPYGEGSWGTC